MTTTATKYEDMSDFTLLVAENIRALAARRGFTQTTLANALGVTQGAISVRWYGKRQWQLEDIARVADVLGTTPWALCQPTPEYEESQSKRLAPVSKLPRLDSNQQPFD
ncbi:helix-turn-helix domain-containing protein [Trueperella pyogenes]|uniref:helix-turn-helix domain-containing protein n=2 Tax=Trueperella pyogenes TaxID=1661 RepID=UPI0009B8F1B1|nr:XRE family transcriptional regulator [Trueperella pyogenes]AZR03747.1 XRE family transcriptional regulator [Trueperella pyogenes]